MPASIPTLSVIVACKNPGPRLAAALESIWAQQLVNPEIIIVDGASSDGSREWLQSVRERLSILISELDHGVYDAMNKGIRVASGEWILFLGADDRLAGNFVLRETLPYLANPDTCVGTGETVYVDGRVYKPGRRLNPIARNFVHHQGTFYRRSFLVACGCFDPTLNTMGDYDLNLRLWNKGLSFEPIPLRISICGARGLSDSGNWSVYSEEIAVRHRHFPTWRCWLWDIGSVTRYLRKKLIHSFVRNHG